MQLEWRFFHNLFRKFTSPDVLVILNCCFAGAAVIDVSLDLRNKAPTDRSIEYLMACSADKISGGQGKTFHNSLIVTLKKMAAKRNPFSITELHKEMVSQVHRWKSQQCLSERKVSHLSPPVLYRLNDEPGRRQILLKSSRTESNDQTTDETLAGNRPSGTLGSGIDCRNRMFAGWKVYLPWHLRRHRYEDNF